MKVITPFHKICALSGVVVVGLIASQAALASGYAIKENSASLLGRAFAGSASASGDLSTIHYNPATLALVEGREVSFSGTYVDPTIKAKNAEGFGPETPFGAEPVGGRTSDDNAALSGVIPAGYLGWNWRDDINFGVAVTSPWALGTNYHDNWSGNLYALKSELTSVNINPMVSYRFNKKLSVAAGVQAQYLEATLTKQAWLPAAPFPPSPATAVHSKVTGNDWGYGYNLGLLYEFSEMTRVGLSYQSAIHQTLEGDATGVSDSTPDPTLNLGLGGALTGTSKANIVTPENVNFSITHGFNEKWTGHAGVQWTRWNRFHDLTVDIENPNYVGGEISSTVDEKWDNTFFYNLGVDYQLNPDWVFRAGVAFDESPIDDDYRTPALPDGDRTWLSIGAGYNFAECGRIDVGYSYVFVEDVSVDLNDSNPNNAASGSLTADYESNVNIVGVSLSWTF